jgi:hypothetical protein
MSNDGARTLAGPDGSLRLSPDAADALREALRRAELLMQSPQPPEGLQHLAGLLVHLRTLRQCIA